MRPLSLSAAMIVRDEEAHLGACLESLRCVVDEIVVVDTGSIDATVEIAKTFGAKVLHHPWNDDFSEARNVSLEHVTGDWVLYIDADERLVDIDRVDMAGLLADPGVVAYRLWLEPVSSSSAYREYRLWRNDPRIRFDGVIHERVVPAIHRVADEDYKAVGLADLRLVHVGYEGDQTRKHLRNLPLLRRQIAADPSNLFARHHLSRVLGGLGESDEAERVLADAVDFARRSPVVDPVASLAYVDLIRCRQRRGESVAELISEAREAFPYNLVVAWISARELIDRGSYTEALDVLQEILDASRRPPDPGDPAYDLRLLAEMPWDAVGLCRFRLGDYIGAADAYGQAARQCPSEPRYKAKQVAARARAASRSTGGSMGPAPARNAVSKSTGGIGRGGYQGAAKTEVTV